MDKEKLKQLLEDTARESGLKIKGEIVKIKTPEQKKAEKDFQEWKEKETNYKILPEFKTAHELIKCLLKTKHYSGFLLTGEGGLGKSVLTLSSVKKNLKPIEWEYSNGYTTPLALYQFLYNNREKKLIILDDVEGVFNNKLSLAILKGALWGDEGKRICHYSSTSERLTTPKNFVMKAKIVILCNEILRENNLSTRAMISRTILYKVSFSFEQKMKICEEFIKEEKDISEEKKKKVLEILKTNVSETTKDFNFRTLRKLIAFVEYNEKKAESLFKETTEVDEIREAYFEVVKLSTIVNTQIKIFSEKTGRGRATFFRVKRSVKVSSK